MHYLQDIASMKIATTFHPDAFLRALLSSRMAQLSQAEAFDTEGLVHFIVFEPGDTLADLKATLGFSPFQNLVDGSCFGQSDFTPSWEWIARHDGWFELVWIFSDWGNGAILFVQAAEGVAEELLSLCRVQGS